jgi:O-antigen/teichoic acid export membrane protein
LFCVIAPAIVLSDFSYEWFYTGIEDQLYITIRFIVVKIVQLALIFFCVKQAEDFIIYAGIIVGLNSVSTLLNIIHLRKFVHFVPISQLNIKRHLKAVLLIFFAGVASTIYMHLDVTMVGIMVGDIAVGFYTAANKIVRIVISLIISLPATMIPRIENCLRNGDREKYKAYLDRSLRFILLFSVPCCLGIIIFAPEIIHLIAGKAYFESILSLRLLAPIIIIVGIIEFVGFQILLPNRKEKYFTISVSVAALLNGFFNFLMIPVFRQNGAILGTVLAEMIVLILQMAFAWKLLKDTELFSLNTIKYFAAGIIMAVVMFCIKAQAEDALPIVLYCFFGALVYGVLLIVLQERTIFVFCKKYFSIISSNR